MKWKNFFKETQLWVGSINSFMEHIFGPNDDAYWDDDHPPILDEVTYKDILHHIDPRDLPHRDYAPLIPFVRYVATKQNTMKFFVPNRFNGWNVYVRFPQWKTVLNDKSLNANEAARLLLWTDDIQWHCGCPSFKFYGYEYVLTQLNAAIIPEVRFPHIRNPQLKGVLCKHGRRCCKVLPFHLGNMASAIKQQRSQSK